MTPADKKKTPQILESAYFHTGNGGLVLNVVESEYGSYKDGARNFELEASFSHHAIGISTTFPLGSMEVVGWLHDMTGRLLKVMADTPTEARHFAFDYHPEGEVRVENGVANEYKFRYADGKLTVVPDERSTMTSGSGGVQEEHEEASDDPKGEEQPNG